MSNTCAEVRYVSTDIVRPANYCSSQNQASGAANDECIELSKWDITLLKLGYTQRGLLYSCKHEEDKRNAINRLKMSLALALDYFFPLAGRLAVRKHNNVVDASELAMSSVYIDCNSAGAEFIHAIADNITIGNILDPIYVPRVVHESLFSLDGIISFEGVSKPLLSVQVTELIDGIFIGCSMNHSVCDGTSLWHFLNSWSEISRETSTTTPAGSSTHHISRIPLLKRWFPEGACIPIHIPFSIDCKSFKETYTTSTTATSTSQLKSRIFHFTAENIARLKAKANLCISAEKTSTKISSLQALLAHFWVAITRARCLNRDDDTSYLVAIGYRDRLNPPVCQEYFGNMSQPGLVTVKVGELLERGIGWGAVLLNQMIMSHDDKAIRGSWDSWIKKQIPFFPLNRPIQSSSESRYSLVITGSSPRFNMYGNDFGWGRPIAVRSGNSSKHDGVVLAHPGPNEGSIEFEACLSVETFKALENNAEFMEFVTVLPPYES